LRFEGPLRYHTWVSVTRADIDSSYGLYLWKIYEQDGELALRIEIGESVRAPRLFCVRWPSYIAYQISGESISTTDERNEFDGKIFRHYTKSAYLDYVRATSTTETLGAEIRKWVGVHHWALYCLDHTIDVVSFHEPEISATYPPNVLTEQMRAAEKQRRAFEEALEQNRERSIIETAEKRRRAARETS
jgi:hypothetical protein